MTVALKNNIGNQTLIFANTLEDEALGQIKKLINSDAYKNARVRIMPDAHAGKGCTIGTTMTITDKITPNLVGVDIGCGMLTIKLNNNDIDFARLDNIIRTKVPGGTKIHETIQKKFDFSGLRCKDHVDLSRANHSIGSLGGGNHFIEVSRADASGNVYLIIHSGSRKLGTDTCRYYQNKAIGDTAETKKAKKKLIKELKKKGKEKDISRELMMLKKPEIDKDLAFLTGADFDDYMNDMAIVQRYASANRETMAEIILQEAGLSEISRFETIHNYIDFKRRILRKGAVSAEKGETLLIPINMRDGSLLCIGKGNEDWNFSAPHGAGRLMSRRKAKDLLDMDTFKNSMKDIYTTSVSTATLDEAPHAYKSMNEIKEAITDTVKVIDILKPLYNFKAH
ncbi:RtcB family protein [Marinilabilia rubra]|uniref:3'-phosphate/5'-hydroxy nucleic acid ligase n=1 Tax=Marinilabilia rubra TaxID=2162893 RepID=A0A2U2B9Z1_9BACT|nr:RtcB family protein [Marinilabilia rubra]PWD99890.1 RNA-splicing ligase RtcB [Marinilabilia rubra]